jgi:hypothetical protein
MSTSKRHFTAVIGKKEHGLYCSSNPSSAAKKIVSKLCASDKKKKVSFFVRETTQGSKKKVYGPYIGEMKKLEKPIELKDRLIKYESVAHLEKLDERKTVKTKSPIMKKIKKMSGGGNRLLVISYPNSNIRTIIKKLLENLYKVDNSSFKLLGRNKSVPINDEIHQIYEGVNLENIRSELLSKYNRLEHSDIYFTYLNITDNFDVDSFMKNVELDCKWITFPEIHNETFKNNKYNINNSINYTDRKEK